jgi:hypothetical protein
MSSHAKKTEYLARPIEHIEITRHNALVRHKNKLSNKSKKKIIDEHNY